MPIAIADYLLRLPEAELPGTVRQLGFDGLEISYGPAAAGRRLIAQPDGPTRLRTLAKEHGVELPSLSASFFLWHRLFEAPAAQQTEYVHTLLRLTDAAAEAGIPLLHLPCFDAPNPSLAAGRKVLLDVLRPILARAAERGVRLSLETLWLADEMRTFLAAANSPLLSVSYDTGNARAAGRDLLADLTLLSSDLGQVRIKDRARREPFTSVPLGQGSVNFAAVLGCLRTRGYAGWLVLTTPSGSDPLAAARQNMGYLRSMLPPVAAVAAA